MFSYPIGVKRYHEQVYGIDPENFGKTKNIHRRIQKMYTAMIFEISYDAKEFLGEIARVFHYVLKQNKKRKKIKEKRS
jgi:ubiquitin C-terminal hydrolase